MEDKFVTDSTQANELLIQTSSKLLYLDQLLPEMQKANQKVIIYSQLVRMLDILEDYLLYRDYKYERIDGSVTRKKRQEAVNRFNTPGSDCFIFLITTRSGHSSVDTISADTIIFHDSDSKLDNDITAKSCCKVKDKSQKIKIYRLLNTMTYEQSAFEQSAKKLGIDPAILSNVIQSVPAEPIAKATFTAATTDVAIDDPNFWEKILPQSPTNKNTASPDSDSHSPIRKSSRTPKQLNRFGEWAKND
eukprot:TRINITY_DN21725_c0_g1_i1.p1 TRINITY_DN21725_c0_g1~~TRINITY_DN21725_c0_g1_i1.p1  ORF type:complete len:247 (+),score=39.89 TRINITY_DN21725_c0_g1_i1:239-979(+)